MRATNYNLIASIGFTSGAEPPRERFPRGFSKRRVLHANESKMSAFEQN
jgi:hypothetical protein